MTRLQLIFLTVVCTLLLPACRHRDFCEDHPDHAPACRLLIQADYRQEWEIPTEPAYANWRQQWPAQLPFTYASLLPEEPEGLRVIAFPPADEPFMVNLPPHGGEMQFFQEGEHALLMFNNDTESIVFSDLNSWAASRAGTRTRYRSSYTGSPYYVPETKSERTVSAPDMVYGYYHVGYPIRRQSGDIPVLNVTLQPLVYTYVVRCEITSGGEYVALARGALAGMAEGVWLSTGRTTATAATILFDAEIGQSQVVACVKSFGVPDFPNPDYTRTERRYALNIELCTRAGKVYRFDYDVTDQVAAQPRGGVIQLTGLTVPADESGVGSGFTVDVTDWGETEDIIL